jgi:sugar porter (SP) family MFS transporter
MNEPLSASLFVKTEGSVSYVVLLTLVAALGGLLFGYDTAVISGAIGFLKMRFGLDALQAGWAASCALVGCILGACVAGALTDHFGRKKVLLTAAVLFAVSAVGSAIPRDLTELVIARILGGIGIGIASMTSPLYIAEVSPARMRGRLVSMNQFAIIFGMLVVYFVNARVARMGDDAWNVAVGWRWMFGSGTLPAVVFLALLFFVPESPRWLVKQDRPDEALAILARVGGAQEAPLEVARIQEAIAHEGGSFADLFRPGMGLPLAIGVVLAILQQVTGINTVLYYAPEIFKKAGLMTTAAMDFTVLVGVVNLLFTVVAIGVVDLVGRKPLLLIASAGMGVSLFVLGAALNLRKLEGPWVVGSVLVYVAAFAVAMGPVVWVVMSEIFPTRIRGRAMSVATVCLWIACFLVSQFFLVMLQKVSGYAFFVYGGMCVVAFVFVLACVPETKGKSLEEIERGWLREAEYG